MFGAICDSCGKDCEVPFRPTSGKPVLCDNCFKSDKRPSRDSNGSSGGNIQELANINAKLDYIVKALEQLSILPKTTANKEEKSVKKDAKKSTPVKIKSKAKKADIEIEEVVEAKPKKAPAKKKATAKKKK
jgi:CxxC-x17-CxxC domain-containing protein